MENRRTRLSITTGRAFFILLLLAVDQFASPESAHAQASQVAQNPGASFPRIAMLWSPASQKLERWANMAQHDLLVVGPESLGLEWSPHSSKDLSTSLTDASKTKARKAVANLKRLNPNIRISCELYFFEADENSYPSDSPWWLRDADGRREQFWPGCYSMDLSRDDYIAHIAARAAALHQALDGEAGLFLDNLRFDAVARTGWTKLLTRIGKECGDMPILVNAGWASDDLEWVAPLINGVMYEDALAHTKDNNVEAFYARINRTDGLLKKPRISVNERFGKRTDEQTMRRELIRTLVYTDMHYLYADSTNGHHHDWWSIWSIELGSPVGDPAVPAKGKLAQRKFTAGTVLWLPSDAEAAATIKLPYAMNDPVTGKTVESVTVRPGEGTVLLKGTD